MPSNRITLDELAGDMGAVHGRLKTAAIKGMRLSAQLARTEVIREIGEVKPHQPVDQGGMKRGWKTAKVPRGAELFSTTPQAVYQEFGTGPAAGRPKFTPPFEPLLEWARRKVRRRAPRRAKKGPKKQKQKKPPEDEISGLVLAARRAAAAKRKAKLEAKAQSLAGKAWRSIRKFGVKPKNFFRTAQRKFPKIVVRTVTEQLKKVKS